MRYRRVAAAFWADEKVRTLSDQGKLAFLHLLTHPDMTSVGAMRGTLAGLAAELGWAVVKLRRALAPAIDAVMIELNEAAAFIALPNFLRHNPPENSNVCKGWAMAILTLVPECPERAALAERCRHAIATLPQIADVNREPFLNAFETVWRQSANGLTTVTKPFRQPFRQPFRNPEQFPEQFKSKNSCSTPGEPTARARASSLPGEATSPAAVANRTAVASSGSIQDSDKSLISEGQELSREGSSSAPSEDLDPLPARVEPSAGNLPRAASWPPVAPPTRPQPSAAEQKAALAKSNGKTPEQLQAEVDELAARTAESMKASTRRGRKAS